MIKAVTIYLGSKCNLHCSYCHRVADEYESGVTDNLLKLLQEKRPETIRFFGGEPLLYIDDIIRVVKTCSWAKFVITTNGVLLRKYEDFLKRHHFKIILSFDGSNVDLRGFRPDFSLSNYPSVGISTTLYHGNIDFNVILKNFCELEKILERPLTFFPHIMHHTSADNEVFSLTKNDAKKIIKEYRLAIEKFWHYYEQYGLINKRYASLFTQLSRECNSNYQFGETYCMSHDRLKVNANGESFNCLYIRNVSAKENKNFIEKHFPKCKECYFYSMCGSACVQSLSHEIECYFYYNLYSFFLDFINNIDKNKLSQLKEILKC